MAQSYRQGCVDVIQLGERLTLPEIESARSAFKSAIETRLPLVVIDLRKVKLVDSAGLELLCDVQSTCLQQGGSLRLAAACPLLRDVFRVTGLDQEFTMHADVSSAAGEFAL